MELVKYALIICHVVNLTQALRWNDEFYVKRNLKRNSECKTIEGDHCVFPFRYKNEVFRKCTKTGGTKEWCSTEIDSNGEHKWGKWGYCDPKCSKINFKPNVKDINQVKVCTPSQCCPSFSTPIWDEYWSELSPSQAAHWRTLGWNEVLWDKTIYKKSTMAFCYKSLTNNQLNAVQSLCYDQQKWDAYMLDQFNLNCDSCSDGKLCALLSERACVDAKVKLECPKKCGNCNSALVRAPSLKEYNSAKSYLRDVMVGDNIPAAVRLAFHDCVGPNGCDGCINPNKNSDFGLQPIIQLLVTMRNEQFTTISNADFWQIAGIVALENANPKIEITFKGGRPDCPTSPTHDAFYDFPDPAMSRSQMMGWFRENESGFGMNEKQVTALLGAHSLGRARKENSGYRFSWTPTREHVFDNEFYQLIRNFAPMYANENQTDRGDDLKYQWVVKLISGEICMLLNTDMELAYDIDVDNAGDGTQCIIPFDSKTERNKPYCPEAPTKKWVDLYAQNENAFLHDFKEAYEVMMTAKIVDNLEVPN